MWNCPYSNDSFPVYAEDIDGGDSPSVSALCEAAKAHNVTLVGGSVPERSNGKLYNTCCVISSSGKVLAKHRCVDTPH
jgi:omega-amidase